MPTGGGWGWGGVLTRRRLIHQATPTRTPPEPALCASRGDGLKLKCSGASDGRGVRRRVQDTLTALGRRPELKPRLLSYGPGLEVALAVLPESAETMS